MKKILLGTTGLVAAAMFANAATAQTPKVTIGGFADFQAGFVSDDLDGSERSHGFRNDTEVSVRVDGKSDAGLGYGAVIDLEADVSADADGEGVNASRTYVYLEGNFGRFELGSNQGAGATMRVDASSLAVATGGIDGAWTYFANSPAGVPFITTPSLPLEHGSLLALGGETTDNVSKITYYSPRYSGFQLGISYQPDFADRGQLTSLTDVDAGESGENLDVGVNYEGQWGEVSAAAAVTGQFGDGETAATEDLGAWNAGLNLGYAGFQLAGSYGDWDDSLGASSTDGDYWTLGLGYSYGAFGASATYMDSSYEVGGADNDFDNLVLGADYQLAPGLVPYAELSFYDFDAAGTASDNDGTVFILGTQLSF